ncbi:MAG: hypothetical protein ACLQU3_31125 [Limisphaerales bacterium]
MKHSAPYKARPEQDTATPLPAARADAKAPKVPIEPITSAPEKTPERIPSAIRAPYDIMKWGEDRYYTRHWGINE